jgi:hypothetical protein
MFLKIFKEKGGMGENGRNFKRLIIFPISPFSPSPLTYTILVLAL